MTDDASFQQSRGETWVGGEVEIREQDLSLAEHGDFRRLRFFHLQDHLCGVEDGFGVGNDGCALRLVLLVVDG